MKKLLLFIIPLFFSLIGFSQSFSQVGFDINGSNIGDNFGYSVDINSLGSRTVIGAPYSNINGANCFNGVCDEAGNVRVFEWDGISWVQLGQDISGQSYHDHLGSSVSMNSAGDIIVIGAACSNANCNGTVRVFQWDGFTWNQLGPVIDPFVFSGAQLGFSVCLNSDGNRFVVGALYGDGAGTVFVYEWDGVSWTQLGNTISGINLDDYFGHSVSMNSDGDRIIIGSPGSDDFSNGNLEDEKGLARIYEWDGTSWIQLGQDILGLTDYEECGYSVSINSSGNIVAIGSPWQRSYSPDGTQCFRGQVRTFELINSSWVQLGQIIQNDTCDLDPEVFGSSIALNSIGNTLIVGSPASHVDNIFGSGIGSARVFKLENSLWQQYGGNIDNVSLYDLSGVSVALNSIGNRYIIGSPNYINTGNPINDGPPGLARVFENDGCNLNSTEICLITVDSTSSRNLVVWEKPLINSIDSFLIYRESGTNNYIQVGSVAYDSLSQFVDSTNGINPNITSYRYKISALDTCGFESDLSNYHETIFLSVNQGVNGENYLIWDAYEGFNLNYYYILRDSTFSGNWEVLDSVSNNNFIYADLNPPISGVNYVIEVLPPNTCTSTKAQDHNSTRSNRANIVGGGGQGIFQHQPNYVNVHPNPTSNQITIDIKGYNGVVNVEVYDLQGRLLETTTNTIVSLKKHAKGIYVLKVSYGGITEEFRVVRE